MIIVAIVGLIATWTTFNNRLANAEHKITQLEEVVTAIQDLNVRIAVIQTDINYIKLKIQ
jgi:uncharacterized small protein (DUF1192 family)